VLQAVMVFVHVSTVIQSSPRASSQGGLIVNCTVGVTHQLIRPCIRWVAPTPRKMGRYLARSCLLHERLGQSEQGDAPRVEDFTGTKQ
jgi:hypothetical protein